jgi:hypothetical protein
MDAERSSMQLQSETQRAGFGLDQKAQAIKQAEAQAAGSAHLREAKFDSKQAVAAQRAKANGSKQPRR